MAGDMLGIGTSGLLAYQQTLSTISHNISNVNTEGYSRQRTELTTRPPQGFGNGFIGTGVSVTAVNRIYDQFLVDQVQSQTSRASELDAFYTLASRIDNLLADPQAGLTPMMQEFYNAVQGVADAPASTPARQVMLTSAESMVERVQGMYDGINSLNSAINLDITTSVAEINALATNIADLNGEIVSQLQRFGQPPNDLMDQRDELIRQLSERITVSTVNQGDGAINVFVGTGQNLVVSSTASSLRVAQNGYDASQIDIEIAIGGGGSGVNITNSITGGKLGGVMDFKEQILDPALNELGRVVVGLASAFNDQHQLGMTLQDTMGTAFFNDFLAADAVTVADNVNNSVIGAVTATLTDVSKLTADDYILRADAGGVYTLLRQPGNTVAATSTVIGAYPATLDAANLNIAGPGTPFDEGFRIDVGAALGVGDTVLIRPTRTAARDLAVQTNSVAEIAIASPIRTAVAMANLGDSQISQGSVTNTTNLPLVADITLTFNPDAGGAGIPGFDVAGGPPSPILYDPATESAGKQFSFAGFGGITFDISGTPRTGDLFTIEHNNGAVSDNRNGLALATLQTNKILVNGTADTQGAYGQLVSMIGTKTHQADISGQAQRSVLEQSVAAREGVSGVNLDEEAANLIRFQQAYQATSKVIATAQTLFQTLLDAVR